MSIELLKAAWDVNLPMSKKMILIYLADKANSHALCWPSIATIAKQTGANRKTVIAAISFLEKAEFLLVDRENQASNLYLVYPQFSTKNGSTEKGTTPVNGSPVFSCTSPKNDHDPSQKRDTNPKNPKNLKESRDFKKIKPPAINAAAYRSFEKPESTGETTQAVKAEGLKSIRQILRCHHA